MQNRQIKDELTPDSMTKLGLEVKITSLKELSITGSDSCSDFIYSCHEILEFWLCI